jgi:hypothetical protein
MIIFILALLGFAFFPNRTPDWLRFVSGFTILGSIISGAICITAAIFGRLKSRSQIDDGHEKDAA